MFPLRDVPTVRVAQQPFDLLTLMPLDPGYLGRRVVHKGPADILRLAVPQPAVRIWRSVPLDDQEPDALVSRKPAFDVDNAHGQQTGLVEQGFVATRVDVDVAVGLEAMEDPEGPVANGVRGGQEAGVKWQPPHLPPLEVGVLKGACGLRQGVFGVAGFAVGSGEERRRRPVALYVLGDLGDVAWVGGACYHRRDAGGGGEARGDDLGGHAACTQG